MACFTIVGAGPVGTLMALLLARRGHSIRLFERRADPRHTLPERGRSINLALSARGMLALDGAAVLDRVRPHLIAMPGRMLHEEQQGLQFLPYGNNEHEANYAVSRDLLNRVLIEAAAQFTQIELNFNQRCTGFDPNRDTLQLRDEHSGWTRNESAQIVLAADGAGSSLRDELQAHGICRVTQEPLTHDYKELVIPAGNSFEPHALHIWPRGGFMLIALPNTDGSLTATLFLPRHGDISFDSLDSCGAVRRFFAEHFADAAAAIPDLADQFSHHPQSRLGTVYCEGWCLQGWVVLIGDAAHAMVPFHGQGLNCGFEDCGVLDRLLAEHSDTAQAFAAFEQQRRPNTLAIAAMALENYVEMRDDVRSPQFAQRKALAAELERQFPNRFIPRYSMVTFHPEISYAEARRRGAQQEQILDTLSGRFPSLPLPASALDWVRRRLDDAGL